MSSNIDIYHVISVGSLPVLSKVVRIHVCGFYSMLIEQVVFSCNYVVALSYDPKCHLISL